MFARFLSVTLVVCVVLGLSASPSAFGELVAPTGVTANSEYGGRPAIAAIDGSGMSPAGPVTVTSTASRDPDADGGTMWMTDNVTVDSWITFDLGSIMTLSGFHLWNYNEAYNWEPEFFTRSGIQNAQVYYGNSPLNGSFGGTLAQSYTFTKATGLNTYAGEDYTFTSPVTGQYVQIRVLTHFPEGEANYVGISEIRFAQVPEPGSMLLLATGLLGLLAYAWRRRRA